jgi:protease-4
MRTLLTLLAAALAAAGCQPLQLAYSGRLGFATPLHVVTDSPPVPDGGPVVEMHVGGDEAGGCTKVAIVDVDGLLVNTDPTGPYSLGENPVAMFQEKLAAAADDPNVCAVVLRINSPGGSVAATDMMWHELRAFRARTHLPVIACLLDVGAGGAYYLATAADLIIAQPTSITGGIGVILNLYNLVDAMQYFNVRGQPIKSGPNIDMGNQARGLTEEAKQLLQTMADEFHVRFENVVEQARPHVDRAGGTTFDGRVFTAQQALQRGLIDRIGYLEDAVDAARQVAGKPAGQVVLLHRPNDVARSPYAITPNVPVQGGGALPVSVPGIERSRLPAFLYLWQPEPTLERLTGK